MNEEIQVSTLNHFAMTAFKDAYWRLDGTERAKIAADWLSALRSAAPKVDIFQTTSSAVDAIVWSALEVSDKNTSAVFFDCLARAANPFRAYIETVSSLWGFTHPSQYSKARSRQEIDPFSAEHKPYLVIYPFSKSADWYLLGRDVRQGVMNEHIRIGKQYEDISQLLLYSFGLQDQEFVVVYETDDLRRFSDLVYELRSTEARRSTALDTPVHTAIYRSPTEVLDLWK